VAIIDSTEDFSQPTQCILGFRMINGAIAVLGVWFLDCTIRKSGLHASVVHCRETLKAASDVDPFQAARCGCADDSRCVVNQNRMLNQRQTQEPRLHCSSRDPFQCRVKLPFSSSPSFRRALYSSFFPR
jgi:hypothetical protein